MRKKPLPDPDDYVGLVLQHLAAVESLNSRKANRLFGKIDAITDRWREELPDHGLERLRSLADHSERHVRVKVGWALIELDPEFAEALFFRAAQEGPGEDLIAARCGLCKLRGLDFLDPIPGLDDSGAEDAPE